MKRRKSILSVIPLALLFAIIVGLITYFTSDKLGLSSYRAQAKILTTNKDSVSEEDNLALAFAATIDSDAIKNKVISNLGLDMQLADLDKELSIVPIKSSPIINIVIEDPIKLKAEDLADEYADVSVKLLNDLYNGNSQVLEYSYNNSGKKSQKEKYSLFFAIVAFVVFFLFASLFTAIYNRRLDKEIAKPRVENQKKTKPVANTNDHINKEEEFEEEKIEKYKELGQIPEYEEDDLDV